MSPIYEFYCDDCHHRTEEYRQMADYTPPKCEICDGPTFHVISVPQMHVWEAGRYFPNVSRRGDGSECFESRAQYEAHLKQHNMAESSTDAPVKTPHGADVTVFS